MVAAPSSDQLQRAISMLGASAKSADEVESALIGEGIDPLLARRLVTWIPDVFGWVVLVTQLAKSINLPTTFSARSANGEWVELKLSLEPIVRDTLPLATAMFHSGPRESFRHIAERSSSLNVADNLLNAGASLEGATLSGPALIGIPAEIYAAKPPGFWRRLFG